MGVNGQTQADVVAGGMSNLAQGDLQPLGFGDGVGVEKSVNRLIRGDKRQPVGQFEASMSQAPFLANA